MHRWLPLLVVLTGTLVLSACAESSTDSGEATLFNIVGEWNTSLAIGFVEEGSGLSRTVLTCTGFGTTQIEENTDGSESGEDFKLTTDVTLAGCGTSETGWTATLSAPRGPQPTLPEVNFGLGQFSGETHLPTFRTQFEHGKVLVASTHQEQGDQLYGASTDPRSSRATAGRVDR